MPVQTADYVARGRKGMSLHLPHKESVGLWYKGLAYTVKLVMVEVVFEPKKLGNSSALYRSTMIKI